MAMCGVDRHQRGLLRQIEERFSGLEVTPAGREALAKRTPVTLTRAAASAPGAATAPAALPCDEALLAELGPAFMDAIAEHVAAHGKERWEETAAAPAAPVPVAKAINDTTRETLRRLREGALVEEVAAARQLVASTIWGHVTAAVEAGKVVDADTVVGAEQRKRIAEAFAELGTENLAGVVERLGPGFGFGMVRFCRVLQGRGGDP